MTLLLNDDFTRANDLMNEVLTCCEWLNAHICLLDNAIEHHIQGRIQVGLTTEVANMLIHNALLERLFSTESGKSINAERRLKMKLKKQEFDRQIKKSSRTFGQFGNMSNP